MKKIFNVALAATIGAAAVLTTSCNGNNPNVPTQKEIETKIIGKWKSITQLNKETLTNDRFIETYEVGGKGYESSCNVHPETHEIGWINKLPFTYTVSGDSVIVMSGPEGGPQGGEPDPTHQPDTTQGPGPGPKPGPEPMEKKEKVLLIDDSRMSVSRMDGEVLINLMKVNVDYSKAIIGLWEGVEMTGYETYGNAEARIEYKADGTYAYYHKVNGEWEELLQDVEEWNVDGDWLATRWSTEDSEEVNYEWWDIESVNGETMKWSAIREKEDGTRFNTTFTWKKITL